VARSSKEAPIALKWIGCSLALAIIVAIPVVLVVKLGWGVSILIFLSPLVFLAVLGVFNAYRTRRRFRDHYGPLGKDLIIVYSDSPHWSEHIESNWIPRWGARAVVVNLSRRNSWRREQTPEAEIVQPRRRERDHPFVILVPRDGYTELFRFHDAFRKRKFGDGSPLALMEANLEAVLAKHTPPAPSLEL
jgi:hypothetical protein